MASHGPRGSGSRSAVSAAGGGGTSRLAAKQSGGGVKNQCPRPGRELPTTSSTAGSPGGCTASLGSAGSGLMRLPKAWPLERKPLAQRANAEQ